MFAAAAVAPMEIDTVAGPALSGMRRQYSYSARAIAFASSIVFGSFIDVLPATAASRKSIAPWLRASGKARCWACSLSDNQRKIVWGASQELPAVVLKQQQRVRRGQRHAHVRIKLLSFGA